MKDLKAYHRTGEGFDALKKAMGNLRDESLKDEAVAGTSATSVPPWCGSSCR